MANPRIANSLDVLRHQVDAIAPDRDKSSDGWIASEQHHQANPTSDHEANSAGVVTALDVTHDPTHGMDTYALAEQLLAGKDERVKYLISNRKIASGTEQAHSAWVWRKYDGSNPHDMHIHVSVKGDAAHYDSTAQWAVRVY